MRQAYETIRKNQNLIYFSILVVISIIYLTDPGPAEIQPWDEAVYATRAKSIVQFGDWLDQTEHAPGGLHSGVYPPLYIWLTAINMQIFGDTPLAIRLWSMIFSVATLFIIFFIPKSKLTGFFSALVLALTPYYYFYSHQGQLDIAIIFFISLSLLFYKKFNNTGDIKWIWFIGIAFGFALMTKIIVGLFIPMIFIAFFAIDSFVEKKPFKEFIYKSSIIFFTGAMIALPWYYYMYSIHAYGFIHHYFGFHIYDRMFSGVERKAKILGYFYYINQLIVMFSAVSLLSFLQKFSIKDKMKFLIFLTFIIPFVTYSISVSKLQHYMLTVFPAISLMAGFALEGIWSKKKVNILLVISTILVAVWSFSQDLRNDIKSLSHSFALNSDILIYTTITIILILTVIILHKKDLSRYFVVFVFSLLFLQSVVNPRMAYFNSHIKEFSNDFKNNNASDLYFIDSRYGTYLKNSQMGYYLNGIDLNWEKDKQYHFINIDTININENYNFKESSYVIIATSQMKKRNDLMILDKAMKKKNYFLYKDSSYYFYKISIKK